MLEAVSNLKDLGLSYRTYDVYDVSNLQIIMSGKSSELIAQYLPYSGWMW